MKPRCSTAEHLTRRDLLKGALLTSGGAAVANWGGLTGSAVAAEQAQRTGKRCILLWMAGGASQFETFDMKVGATTGGPFREISTNVAGTRVCELLPNIAQKMDKLAVIRSMRTSDVSHPGGTYLMHTAYRKEASLTHPEIGAVVAKYLGKEESDLPNFVQMVPGGQSGPTAGSGYLGPAYNPFRLGMDGRLSGDINSYLAKEEEQQRNDLRTFMEQRFTQYHQATSLRAHHEAYLRTRRLMQSLDAFNVDQEWEQHRELYGDSQFGRSCVLARRLLERGVAFVEVGAHGYDTHADNFTGHKALLPTMEKAWAGLLTDLEQRGMLEDTLVIWMGEIGRTPNINNRAGRDHYVKSWSTALAGCGIQGGVVYGRSDEKGILVAENPVSEGDFFATVYTALGIDPESEHFVGTRPIPITLQGSQPVKELFA